MYSLSKLASAVQQASDGAEIREDLRPGGDRVIEGSWAWPSDGRPHRRSRTLQFVVSRELLDDFEHLGANRQQAAREQVRAAVENELRVFQKAHETPADEPPPVEVVRITSAILS